MGKDYIRKKEDWNASCCLDILLGYEYKAVNHQLCILNQAIVDKYLTFVSSTIIKED